MSSEQAKIWFRWQEQIATHIIMYTFREIAAPPGYILDSTVYTVCVNACGETFVNGQKNQPLITNNMPVAAYSVVYNPNGGTVLSTAAANVSNPGYNFASWNTESDGSGITYVPGDVITINSDVALYAQWTPVQTDFSLERATSLLPAYQAAPNTWPLHGTILPNLYMVDCILITLSPTPPFVVKWAYGVHDSSYFETNGFDIIGTYTEGIPVDINSVYTVYAALPNGFIGVECITSCRYFSITILTSTTGSILGRTVVAE